MRAASPRSPCTRPRLHGTGRHNLPGPLKSAIRNPKSEVRHPGIAAKASAYLRPVPVLNSTTSSSG